MNDTNSNGNILEFFSKRNSMADAPPKKRQRVLNGNKSNNINNGTNNNVDPLRKCYFCDQMFPGSQMLEHQQACVDNVFEFDDDMPFIL